MNPHALRHRILSPARLPFRHSRERFQAINKEGLSQAVAVRLASCSSGFHRFARERLAVEERYWGPDGDPS